MVVNIGDSHTLALWLVDGVLSVRMGCGSDGSHGGGSRLLWDPQRPVCMAHAQEAEPSAGPPSPVPWGPQASLSSLWWGEGSPGIGLGTPRLMVAPEMGASEKVSGVGSGASWLDQEGAQGQGSGGAGSHQHASLSSSVPSHVWDARYLVLAITWASSCSHVQLLILECQGTLTTTSHGAFKIRATNM